MAVLDPIEAVVGAKVEPVEPVLPVDDPVIAVARSENEDIRPGAALEVVVLSAADQRVVAAPPLEPVDTPAACRATKIGPG